MHAYMHINAYHIYIHITPKNHNQIIQHVCLLQSFLRCFPIFPQPREASRPASRGKLVDGLAPSTSTVNRRVEEMEVGVGQVIRKVPRFHHDFWPKMMGISAWLKDQKPILTSHSKVLQTAKREVTESQSGTSAYISWEWMMPQASKNCISACQPEMPRRKAIEHIWTCHVLPKPARKMFRSQESVCQTRISRMTRNWCKRWGCEWKGLRWCR